MEPRRSKHYLARIPTIALLVLFAMSPELSILFFILRAIDRDALLSLIHISEPTRPY